MMNTGVDLPGQTDQRHVNSEKMSPNRPHETSTRESIIAIDDRSNLVDAKSINKLLYYSLMNNFGGFFSSSNITDTSFGEATFLRRVSGFTVMPFAKIRDRIDLGEV